MFDIKFSNPRLEATFPDWPYGSNKRGECRFWVENHATRGYRVGRQTFGKPKYDTYGGRAVIVDGSNGKTYILQFAYQSAGISNFIKISRSDFMNAGMDDLGRDSAVFSRDVDDYATLKALIDSAYLPAAPASPLAAP
jgi:hypothetical protein